MKAAVLVLLISLVIYCPVFTWAETGVFVRGAMPVKLAGDFKFTEGPAVDKDGNIFFTDQPNDRIMKWSTDDKMTTFLQPSGRSNGLYFDLTGKLIACADENNELWSIDTDGNITTIINNFDGKLLNGPNSDGMTIDSDGNIYLTGKGVTVFNREGKQIDHLSLPESWTGNVCIGGKNRDTLFITAGTGLYAIRLRVRGY